MYEESHYAENLSMFPCLFVLFLFQHNNTKLFTSSLFVIISYIQFIFCVKHVLIKLSIK